LQSLQLEQRLLHSLCLPPKQYTRRDRIAQFYALLTVTNELASPLRDVNQGEACPTNFGFIADQDRATIAKSSTLPYDLEPRVTSPAADEGTQEVEINRLKERVKLLEDRDGVAAQRSKDNAPIKGRSLDEGEATTERISDDSEEMTTVLTSMDAAIVLAGGIADVPTGSGSIPTASPPADEVPTGSDVVPTASPVFTTATVVTPYRRRKGKEVMVESETPKKQRVQEKIDAQVARELEEQLEREDQRRSEQIARDAEIEYHQFSSELPMERRIELISDLVKYQDNYAKVHKFQSQQRKPWTKKQKRDYYMAVIMSNLGWKVKDFRVMTFEEVEAKFNSVWKQLEDFIPMGSKEKAERIKRKGLSLEQESAKKHKISEEVTEEAKSSDEVPEEKFKEMMQLDKEIFMLVENDYPLRKGLALVMISYKLQVDNYSQMANDLILKIYKIANFPRKQVIEFPLVEELPTASEESSHCQKKSEATAVKIALLSKVTGMSKVDKIEAKRKKPGTGMKGVQEIKAEGEFISNLISFILYLK
nr:hypothetical protein [Tanacetum cinerariifolium]